MAPECEKTIMFVRAECQLPKDHDGPCKYTSANRITIQWDTELAAELIAERKDWDQTLMDGIDD